MPKSRTSTDVLFSFYRFVERRKNGVSGGFGKKRSEYPNQIK